jgi:hypothetical protein
MTKYNNDPWGNNDDQFSREHCSQAAVSNPHKVRKIKNRRKRKAYKDKLASQKRKRIAYREKMSNPCVETASDRAVAQVIMRVLVLTMVLAMVSAVVIAVIKYRHQ